MGNETKDETAIQHRLDQELNPGPSGWKEDPGADPEMFTGIVDKLKYIAGTTKFKMY